MKLFTATILLLLNFTSIRHVAAGGGGCHVCAEIQKMNAKLAALQQIDVKLEQINATLGVLLASGRMCGGGSSSSEFTHSFLPFLLFKAQKEQLKNLSVFVPSVRHSYLFFVFKL